MKKVSCVYRITNTANGRIYIGSTLDFAQRRRRHINDLRHGKHISRFMQRDYNKCGAASFSFEIVEIIDDHGLLLSREQHFLDVLMPAYNTAKIAGSCAGIKHRPEVVRGNKERNTGFGNGNAKVTLEQAEEARQMMLTHSNDEIAKQLGVSKSTINRLFKRLGLSKGGVRVYPEAVRPRLSMNVKNIAGANAIKVFILKAQAGENILAKNMEEARSLTGLGLKKMRYGLRRRDVAVFGDIAISLNPIDAAMVAWPYRMTARLPA